MMGTMEIARRIISRCCTTATTSDLPESIMAVVKRYFRLSFCPFPIHFHSLRQDSPPDRLSLLLHPSLLDPLFPARQTALCKSFNVVLNGWSNVVVILKNGERIWKEMGKRGMKDWGIDPDRKVYKAVVPTLAKARLVDEARNVMAAMEEKGIVLNVITYNSLIKPLCQARDISEAKKGFELLETMKTKGCQPNYDTYIMLIRKHCRWRQVDCVLRVWHEMDGSGMSPDRSCYIVLIHAHFKRKVGGCI